MLSFDVAAVEAKRTEKTKVSSSECFECFAMVLLAEPASRLVNVGCKARFFDAGGGSWRSARNL